MLASKLKLLRSKGPLRATIFKSAETVHLISLCYLGDAIRYAVSADSKIVASNRPFVTGMNAVFVIRSYQHFFFLF